MPEALTTEREAQLDAAMREYEAGVKTTELERTVIEAAIEWRKREQGEPMLVDEYEARTTLGEAVDALNADRARFAAECEEKINQVFDSIPGLERVL